MCIGGRTAIDLQDLGLRLLLAGMGLGMSLMTFAVTLDSTSFYQTYVAPTATGAMHPLGYALDGGILLSLAMSIGGMACFPARTTSVPAVAADRGYTAAQRLDDLRRQKAMGTRTPRTRRPRPTAAAHGST